MVMARFGFSWDCCKRLRDNGFRFDTGLVAYISTIAPEIAEGVLRDQYRFAVRRAGKVWSIVRLMSPNPEVLSASMALYTQLMHGPSPLSRGQREMLAVTVSKLNDCHY